MNFKSATLLASAIFLAGCSGGDSPAPAPAPAPAGPPAQVGTYSSLNSASTQATTLSGQAIAAQDRPTTVGARQVAVQATFDPSSNTLSLDNGDSVITDGTQDSMVSNPVVADTADIYYTDGYDPTTNGDGTMVGLVKFADGTYDHVTLFFTSTDGPTTENFSMGYIGDMTVAADSNNATGILRYKGSSAGTMNVDGVDYDFRAESNVDVNFSTNSVDLALRNIRTFDPLTDRSVSKPVISIEVANMDLVDSEFSGGRTRVVRPDGTNVNDLQNRIPEISVGGLFGYDPVNRKPDEAAGVLYVEGRNNTGISAIYIAD